MPKTKVDDLISNGVPKHIRCYSNLGTDKETCDCFTIVFTKKAETYKDGNHTRKAYFYLAMGQDIKSPQGFFQHGSCDHIIDKPSSRHLGKPIKFNALSEGHQSAILVEYKALWDIH